MAKRSSLKSVRSGRGAGTGIVAGKASGPEIQSAGTSVHQISFPIVGIGASAGGLAAFEAFFSGIPAGINTGMAFVLVQHLSPDHKSLLSELVGRYTKMNVCEVTDGMQVRTDCVYIIPPNHDMALMNGALHLLEPMASRGIRLPIDFFFRSLSQDQRENAICIVLSGSGSDGTLGVRAVKGEGGLVMVQDPETADSDGMPRNAIATGLVDYVLPPKEMAAQLIAFTSHAFATLPGKKILTTTGSESLKRKICIMLREHTGHDFSYYKENTLFRRVERRMAIQQIEKKEDYALFLQKNPSECQALFRDLLIGVTNFFRDPEAFDQLKAERISKLFHHKQEGMPVRIWSCACATGEEAYSLAILIQEYIEMHRSSSPVQIFATDIDSQAIEQARAGIFPASIAADITQARLTRFFTQERVGGPYRVQKVIRDMLVFSEQDVVRDPPFSRLDMISCRNLLIYLNSDVQRKLITLFHYALNTNGILFLGPSETVGDLTGLFTPVVRKWKIYQRTDDLTPMGRSNHTTFSMFQAEQQNPKHIARKSTSHESNVQLIDIAIFNLLNHYTHSAVIVNGRGDILHIYGKTGRYLEPAEGDAGMNILNMARKGLKTTLAMAFHQTVSGKQKIVNQGLQVTTDGDEISVNLVIFPALGLKGEVLPDMFIVIFESSRIPNLPVASEDAISEQVMSDTDKRIAALEMELRTKEEYLQSTIEEMETANEELKSTNEEMQSVNEELQSTNEELETSKEELQSVNEELATVNVELQTKVVDLSRANNDMNNLLAGTGIATIFVDLQLCVVRFTPSSTQLINLITADIGRPVGHIVSNLINYSNFVTDIHSVLLDLKPREKEVQTIDGDWFLLRIRPYRTLENLIEGAAITFVDISDMKRVESERTAAQKFAESIVDTVREPLMVLDYHLTILQANRSFYKTFKAEPEWTVGRKLYEIYSGEWDIPDLRQMLEEVLPKNEVIEDFDLVHDFRHAGHRHFRLNGRRIFSEEGQGKSELILLSFSEYKESP